MADALISPAVGGAMWAVSGGLLAYGARKIRRGRRDDLVPMMGVLGAFVFAAQMINFAIPGTGSSGHLGGGLLLAILLGPHAAFLVMASILAVQALFFADGGLLAMGCNLFNLGFFPAYMAYPLLYRPLAGDRPYGGRALGAALVAAVAGLLLGACGVVAQTATSGISVLPFGAFLSLMLPIHAAIGLVEGLATAAVVAFVAKARPEAVAAPGLPRPRPVLVGLAAAAALIGGVGSWFASAHPDGLEWAIGKLAGDGPVAGVVSPLHGKLAGLQETAAVLPDYAFRESAPETGAAEPETTRAEAWPAVDAGTSVSGMVGGVLTLGLAALLGLVLQGRAGVKPEAGGTGGARAG